jgi:uncharacterized protein YbaA (DUF1428 family)
MSKIDRSMQPDKEKMPFDGHRMFWGGFAPILDTETEQTDRVAEPAQA